jgi:hypothetical protein
MSSPSIPVTQINNEKPKDESSLSSSLLRTDVTDLHLLVVGMHSSSIMGTRIIFWKKYRLGNIDKKNPRTMKSAKEQLPPVIETGTLGCLAMAAIPRSTTELKKLVDEYLFNT